MVPGYRALILAGVYGAFLLVPMTVRGDDVAELKATFEHNTAARNTYDRDAYMAFWHDEVAVFGPVTPFPVEEKAALQQLTQAVFTNTESATWTVINPQYRVIGAPGWSTFTTQRRSDQRTVPVKPCSARHCGLDKARGKWVGVAPLPQG